VEAPPPTRLRAHRALVGVCVGLTTVEALCLVALGPDGALALAPQVTAPEPFGILHDLRWLAVFHRSWLAFSVELVALLVFRTGVVVTLTALAWDRDRPRPPVKVLVACALRFLAVVAAVSFAWVTVMFALAVVSLEWLFFVGVPAFLLIALVTHHGVVRARWWREAPPLRTTAWLAFVFVELSLAGALAAAVPTPLAVLVAAGSGLFNAWAWLSIVHVLNGSPGVLRFRPVAPAAIALLATVTLLGVAIGARQLGRVDQTRPAPAVAAAVMPTTGAASAPAVLVATGFNSEWDGTASRPLAPDLVPARFSYRGLGADGRPLPYAADSTHRSLRALIRTMRAQVDALHDRTGRPVSLVAESEGSIVAAAMLAVHPRAPVGTLVLLSPLVHPGRVYYPPEDKDGWGVVTGWALRGITEVVDGVSSIDLPADAPLLRSIDANAAVLRNLLACASGHRTELVVMPVTAALGAPNPPDIGAPVIVVPAVHGGLLSNPTARAAVVGAIRGRHPARDATWAGVEGALRLVAAPWQVPELPITLNPAWAPRATTGGSGCVRMTRAEQRRLG
jgi:hypothetical protein